MNEGFDNLLRKSLREQRGQRDTDAGVCLDADTTAAWFAGTLSAAELAHARAHASRCNRCQEVIAALALIEEPRPAAAWWRGHAVRWLIPAFAAAASAIVWLNVPSEPALAPRPSSSAQARDDFSAPPRAVPGPQASSAPVESPLGMSPAAVPPPAVRNEAARRPGQAVPGFADDARRRITTPPSPERSSDAALAREQTATSVAAPPPAPAPPPSGASVVAEDAAKEAQVTSRVEPQSAGSAAMFVAASPRAAATAVIASPGQRTLWRIAGTQVFRSADAGVTWEQRHTGATTLLTAGAAPSDDVCWIVGRRGLVLRTGDGGQSWQTIAFPITEDLVAVAADNDKAATVTAAGGRMFRTTDGGVRWR